MRTIQELYEIIKQKKENAKNDLVAKSIKAKKEKNEAKYELLIMELKELTGEIDAYTDVLILIESSGDPNVKN